jgi:hypothetical protein
MPQTIRQEPHKCAPGDLVPKHVLREWTYMTSRAANDFKRFTGQKIMGDLVRRGSLIFAVSDAEHAECVYNNPRKF